MSMLTVDDLALALFPGFYLTTVCCIPKLPGAITEPYTPTDINDITVDLRGEPHITALYSACADVEGSA